MKLNCDLGERPGLEAATVAEAVMPYIDQANIACGFHAGDAVAMQAVLQLAKEHNVSVGAHPSYPDPEGFGRRSMPMKPAELIALFHYQVAALEGMTASAGVTMEYVKPHGALYNDMMANPLIRQTVLRAMSSYHRPLPLMMQATPTARVHRQEAGSVGVTLWFEAFADRGYDDDGLLRPRGEPDAVLSAEQTLNQVRQLRVEKTVVTTGGAALPVEADSLCVHGDHPDSVNAIQAIRAALSH